MQDERDTSMPKVATISPHNRAIDAPEELKALPAWLMWRYEQHPGEDKPRKVPYYVEGGRRFGQQGSPQDRGKLTAFHMARDEAARRGFDGVGFALMPDWGLTALDFDKCVAPDGSLPPEITEIISNTYSEYSPSGEGVRAFVRGNLGNHKSYAEGGRYGFETFNTNGFVTITGRQTTICDLVGNDNRISAPSPKVVALCEARFAATTAAKQDDPADFMIGHEPKLGLSISRMEEMLGVLDPDMPREQWRNTGFALHHECDGDDTGFQLWDDWSAGGSKYPGTEALRAQWDSFDRRAGNGQRQITMATVIKMVKQAGGSVSVNPTQAASVDELKQVAELAAETVAANPVTGMQTPPDFDGKFPIVSAGDMTRRKPGDWLIKGVLPKADLVMIYGASGSGKSFVLIDMLAAMARGIQWRGRKTQKVRVILIAAEGGGGVGKRFEAYCRYHGINADDLDIGLIIVPPNFMLKDDISELVKAIAAAGGADFIAIDTLAQVTPGANENAGEDMGLVLANSRALGLATGATIGMVHHSGKDAARGSRGWSGIRAAVDAEIEVLKHENGQREIRTTKMKDGDDGLAWGFKLEVIEVGLDDDGEVITSCVAIEAEMPKQDADDKPQKGGKKLGRLATHILETIETQVDPFLADMPLNDFVQLCVDGMPAPEPGKRDVRKQDLQRSLRNLANGPEAPILIEHGKIIFMTS
jgi:hypothetical protein